jgi:prolyl 4-hydroxylase
MNRIEITGAEKSPNFIGSWFIEPPELCDELIDFFEHNQGLQKIGHTSDGLNKSHKKSTDITILPRNLEEPRYEPARRYMNCLYDCYTDYVAQWPFLRDLQTVDIGAFNIQRYYEGDHFNTLHTERYSIGTVHRVMAWMTYLNDVPTGGSTFFSHYGLDIQPERGKTLIWPAEWTHAHVGNIVTQGTKYVITGWMHFPA